METPNEGLRLDTSRPEHGLGIGRGLILGAEGQL